MTDDRVTLYRERIASVRDAYLAAQAELEERAARGITEDLVGLGALVSDAPQLFIEARWHRWLDARLQRLAQQYDRDAARIREEVGL